MDRLRLSELDVTIPSSVSPLKFVSYFTLPTGKLRFPKIGDLSVIPIPEGIPFIAYYHNKILHSAWTYTDKIRKRQHMPGLKKDIGSRWLKTRLSCPHHDFFIGQITALKADLKDTPDLKKAIMRIIKDPNAEGLKLRYVVTAAECSTLTHLCTPCGDMEWQMRYAHQHQLSTGVQLSKAFKEHTKKVKNIIYNHLSGGLQVKSTRLEKGDLKAQIDSIAHTVKKYGKYPIMGLKICDKIPYMLDLK